MIDEPVYPKDEVGNLILPTDEQPKSGEWVDSEDILASATEDEIAAGEHFGALTPDTDFIELPDGTKIPLTEEGTEPFRLALVGNALALAEAKKLQAIVIKYGVKCTIELMVGRPWTGDDWYSRKYILMNHHTAGSMSGLTPSYALCRRGRTDVPGPLCNGYGGRDLVFRIVCMGLANHPGAGGPLTIDGVTMPKDSARISSFGIEWEHAGLNSTPWPVTMHPFMGKVGAAVLDYLGRKTVNSIEHKTWAPTRKIDRNPGFSQSGSTGQALITKYRGLGADMPLDAADRAIIRAEVIAALQTPVPWVSAGVKAYATLIGSNPVGLRHLAEYIWYGNAVSAKGNGPTVNKLLTAIAADNASLKVQLDAIAAKVGTTPEELAAIKAAADAGVETGLKRMIDAVDSDVTLVVNTPVEPTEPPPS